MVRVFRELRRVLRDDGTAWLNLGDTYGGSRGNTAPAPNTKYPHAAADTPGYAKGNTLRKQLIGIPWRVALALQADGWYLRSDIIWHKPSPMPEGVTDRPTKAHEYLFLLAKGERYYYDADAIAEPSKRAGDIPKGGRAARNAIDGRVAFYRPENGHKPMAETRNARSVWTIATRPYPGAHFATFPPELPERCIKAGTSERGCCPACGAPWVRSTESDRRPTRPGVRSKVYSAPPVHPGSPLNTHARTVCGNRNLMRHNTIRWTVGWGPSCDCPAADPVPCVVLDPFNGSGTTGAVAVGLGRCYVGLDLNPAYLDLSRRRIERPHAPVPRVGAESYPLFDRLECPDA